MRHVLDPNVYLAKWDEVETNIPKKTRKRLEEANAVYVNDDIHRNSIHQKRLRDELDFDIHLEVKN